VLTLFSRTQVVGNGDGLPLSVVGIRPSKTVENSLGRELGGDTAQDCPNSYKSICVFVVVGDRHAHQHGETPWKNPSRRERENFEGAA
jgi:hypothetical protein